MTRSKVRWSRIDVAALIVFAVVWIYYIITVRFGFSPADESLFSTFVQRFMQGDRPLVDEWNLAQFFCLLIYPLCKLFVLIKGGTTGVVLFLRYVFLVFNAVFYWVMYIFLRAYRWPALIATLLFCLHVPQMVFFCNHYTVPFRFIMIVCLILFSGKERPLPLILASLLLSFAVLYQYEYLLLFIGYSILVWIRFFRQKRGKYLFDEFDFCLNMRVWKYLTLGAFICAAAFFGWIIFRGGLKNVLTVFPYTVINPDYDLSSQGNIRFVFFEKIEEASAIYGPVYVIPAFLTIALSIVHARGKFGANSDAARKILFCLACAVWILSCALALRIYKLSTPDLFFTMYPAPTLWLGLVCYLLCRQKNKRILFFWIVGLVSSLCADVFTNSSLSIGSPIAYIADFVFFFDLVRELHAEHLQKKKAPAQSLRRLKAEKKIDHAVRWTQRLTCVCFACWIVFVLLFENTAFPEHLILGEPLFSLPSVIEQGPWAGLHCSETTAQDYSLLLADIDLIKSRNAKNLYICGLRPELYLYADLPYASSSAWGWRHEKSLSQQIPFWKLNTERLPEYIYLPVDRTYNRHGDTDGQIHWARENFAPLCDYTMEQGQSGLILHVSQWHLDAETTTN